MPLYKYKVEAESTSNIEWAKISLEGKSVYLKPNGKKTKFTSSVREIQVDGKLHVFCKCKGDTGIEIKYTITYVPKNKKVLNEQKVVIGDDTNEAPRIGKWSSDIDPV